MKTLSEVFDLGKKKLIDNNCFENKKNDFHIIFEEVFELKIYELEFFENKNRKVPLKIENRFYNFLRKIIINEPLGYILGYTVFYGLKLKVGHGVFIPRFDTETIIDICKKNIENGFKILDLCSGCGTIALTLKYIYGKNIDIHAIEKSKTAFKFLETNRKKYNLDVNIINDCIFSCYNFFQDKSFDIIVSNPPYVKSSDVIDECVKKEPRTSLFGKEDGLYFYNKIIKIWKDKIKSNGYFIFEIGINQEYEVEKILLNENFKNISFQKDLNGINRVVVGQKI